MSGSPVCPHPVWNHIKALDKSSLKKALLGGITRQKLLV